MEQINDIFLIGENLTLDKLITNNIAMQSFFHNNIDDITKNGEIAGIGKAVIYSQNPRQIYFPQAEYNTGILLEEGYNIMQYYEEDEKRLLLRYVPKHVQFVCISYRTVGLVLLKRIMTNLLASVPLFVDNDMGTLLPINELRKTGVMYAFPVTIENNVWIGSNAVINPGVNIGENSVIGSGSVVTKDIPPNVIAVGVPCKVIREINDRDKEYYYKNFKVE